LAKRDFFPKRTGIKGEPISQKNKDRIEPRIKEVFVHQNSDKTLGFKCQSNLDKVHEMPCLVCGCYGVEAHHVKNSDIVGRDDRFLVPLCKKHHTGLVIHDRGEKHFSVHGTPKAFYEKFPKETLLKIAKGIYVGDLLCHSFVVKYI